MILFDKQETTKRASLLLWKWIKKYGIPLSIYCDKRNMYITDGDRSKEKTELNNPKGYFRQMCDRLGILVVQANSPQAKGRVERSNKTHQDRLIKLMRLKNITNIKEANKYLDEEYIEEHNKKFSISLLGNKKFSISLLGNRILDVHKPLDNNLTLDDICYIKETRKVNNDWTISYEGRLYQLKKQSLYRPPCKSTVHIRKNIEGNLSIFYGSFPIEYAILK
jgi:hypothetical protein